MGSNRQTGLLLVIGAIVAAIGWFVLYLPLAGGSPDTTSAQLAQNMIIENLMMKKRLDI